MLDRISIFLNLFQLVLLPNIWSILDNVPCALKNNVYSATVGCNILYISVNAIWSDVSFYLHDISIDTSVVLMSFLLLYYCQFLLLSLLIFGLCFWLLLNWVHSYLQYLYHFGLVPLSLYNVFYKMILCFKVCFV